MARIPVSGDTSILKIGKWLGINENPDGDTQLRPGEAAEMRNFKITQDGNLQVRPGIMTIHKERAWTGPIRGVWHGITGGIERTVFAAGGGLWSYDFESDTAVPILKSGESFTDAPTSFLGFSGKVYVMNGYEYLEWDGRLPPEGGAAAVEGYRPLTMVTVVPSGGGVPLEQVNMLTGARRVRVSPDGTSTVFTLPEKGLKSVDYAKNLATGAALAYTANVSAGTVTFTAAPVKGADTVEIGYTYPVNYRATVEAMRFSEIYNGGTDNRVFIYGDGTNRTFYSGLDYDGEARADYFPDLNVVHVGSANTPVTALIRHYATLAVFKTDSAYSVQYGTISLEGGGMTAAFYVTPSNRSIGNCAPGQVQLVENSPRTLFGSAVYDWRNYSSFASNLTVDERQSKLVSERVSATLGAMELQSAYTFDDNERREYYVIADGTAVINSYATDTWYVYRGFDVTRLFTVGRSLYGCTGSGDIVSISRNHHNDNGAPIDAFWRSGSMSFGRDWQRKYSSRVFVTIKPETLAFINATVLTNRRGDYPRRVVSQGLVSLRNANFRHWSFGVNRQPQTKRLKLRAKRFAYYQLVFESCTDWSTATILAADVRVRFTGDVR